MDSNDPNPHGFNPLRKDSQKSELYTRLSNTTVGKVKFMGKGRGAAKPTTLIAEMEAIRSEANKKAILPTRELYKSDKNAYTKAKQNAIPAYYVSIDMAGKPTDIGCLDIDRKENLDLDMEAAKKLMLSFDWVMFCADSLSFDGFYIFFPYTEGKDHEQAMQAAIDELLLFGIVCDDLKDIKRLRAYSYDPTAYINYNVVPFDFEEVAESKAVTKKNTFLDDFDQFANLTAADDYNQRGLDWFNENVAPDYFDISDHNKGELAYKFFASTNADSMVVFTNTDVPLFTVHSSTLLAHLVANGAPEDKTSFNNYDLTRYLTGKAPFDLSKDLTAAGFGSQPWHDKKEAKPMKPNGKESYSLILEYLSEKGVRLNQLTGVIEMDGAPLNDYHISSMLTELSLYSGKNQSKDILMSCLDVIANGNQYHPFLEFIKSLEKSEETDFLDFDELDELIDCFVSDTPKRLIRIYLIRWMLGLFDLHLLHRMTKNVLVLAGEQNACKTAFSKNILSSALKHYGKVVDFNPNKMTDGKIALCSLLVACFDEFEEILTKHRTLADFKNLTASYDIFERRPYRRNHEQMFRASIVMATTNQSNFLNDSTGNTRFLTINVRAFDLEKYFKIDLDKVWRVIYDLHLAGETSVLSESERALQSQQNQNFEAVDSYSELVEKVFVADENSFLTSTDISIELERYTRQNLSVNRIGAALKKLGYERKSKRINGSPKYGYMLKINYDYD